MDIQIDDTYFITSDERNIILNKTTVAGETCKDAGERRYQPVSFHNTLASALKSFRERKIKLSEAKTLDELLMEVRDLNSKIAQL